MKIAMILDSSFPPDPRVENEAKVLIEHGHEVDLYCVTYQNNKSLVEVIDGINVIRIKVSKLFRSLSALAYTFPLYHWILSMKLGKVFDPNKYDAVHIHDMASARSVFNLKGESTSNFVLDLHENRPEIMKYYEHVNTILGKMLIYPKWWKSFEKKYMQLADNIIVVTQEAMEYYVLEYGLPKSKFTVVPNSVKQDFYENPTIEKDFVDRYKHKFVLLYVGDTGERRGIKDVLEAIKVLSEDFPELLFMCVGSSKSDKKWELFVKENGLQESVELLGWQDFRRFPTFIAASDVGLSPLHRNLHHDTTYANKVFQYMSMGKPVIVSDCKAQAELISSTNSGLVYEASNISQLANCIRKLIEDKGLLEKKGKNAYNALTTTYNWDKLSKSLVELYSK